MWLPDATDQSSPALSPSAKVQVLTNGRVSRYDNAFGASPTASYVDHLNRRGAASEDRNGQSPGAQEAKEAELATGTGNMRALAGQRGVLIGLGGQPAFVELFASPTSLRRHLPGLLEAAAIDAALLPAEATPGRRGRRFVGSLTGAPLGDHLGADAGAGHALASLSPHHEIRGLGWDDEVVHVTVFNRRHHLMELA
jgi:hypothetical protein